MAKSAPNSLGQEVRVKRRNTLIRKSIDCDRTSPLSKPNMTCTQSGHRLFPKLGDLAAMRAWSRAVQLLIPIEYQSKETKLFLPTRLSRKLQIGEKPVALTLTVR